MSALRENPALRFLEKRADFLLCCCMQSLPGKRLGIAQGGMPDDIFCRCHLRRIHAELFYAETGQQGNGKRIAAKLPADGERFSCCVEGL